jgi:hypothetical protein
MPFAWQERAEAKIRLLSHPKANICSSHPAKIRPLRTLAAVRPFAEAPVHRSPRSPSAHRAEATACSPSRGHRRSARPPYRGCRPPARPARSPSACPAEIAVYLAAKAAVRSPRPLFVRLPRTARRSPEPSSARRGRHLVPLSRTPLCSSYAMQMQMHYFLENVYCARRKTYTVHNRQSAFCIGKMKSQSVLSKGDSIFKIYKNDIMSHVKRGTRL